MPAKESLLEREERTRDERSWLRFTGVGIQYGVTITLFVLAGAWLDRRYPSLEPLFTLLGAGLGIVGATASLVYGVLAQSRKEAKRK